MDSSRHNPTLPLDTLIHDHGRYLYNYALKLSCHPADAEDLTQETFLKAWLHLDQLKNKDSLRSWLRTICLNEFRMKMRKSKKEELLSAVELENLQQESTLLVDSPPSPEDELLLDESIEKLRNGCFMAMVRRLTLNQRIVFSLVDMFGLRPVEVAALLELSEKAIKGLLYRGRMNLDSFFEGHCNLLDINNPCSCQAWINFSQNRNNMQAQVHKKVKYLDFKEKGYQFNPVTRRKILHYYHQMPDATPSADWYKGLITLVEKFYRTNS